MNATTDRMPGTTGAAFLGAPEVRRVVLSLLAAFQDAQIRAGRLSRDCAVAAVVDGRGPEEQDGLVLDDAQFGVDSLGLLDLVGRVDVFFGLAATGIEDHLFLHRRIGDWVHLVESHLRRMGCTARITFETSGSVGTPKRISHATPTLESEVAALRSGPLGGRGSRTRVLSAVPDHHIYGFLWGVLLPARCGWSVVDLPHGAPGPILRHARPGDIVLATPFTWDRIAALDRRLPTGVTGVSSGGPATAATWAAVETAGLSRMIEVYGSTETGGVGWRDAEDAPFRLFADIAREGGALQRLGVELTLQDHVEWDGPEAFRVIGRRDETVQVAGVNVDLEALRRLLAAQPGVSDVAVRPDGERLKAFVATAEPPGAGLEQRLRAAMLALPAPARPVRYAFGPHLPLTATGKPANW